MDWMEVYKIGSLLKGFSLSESSRGSSEVHVQMEKRRGGGPRRHAKRRKPLLLPSQKGGGGGGVMKSTDLTLVGLHCG